MGKVGIYTGDLLGALVHLYAPLVELDYVEMLQGVHSADKFNEYDIMHYPFWRHYEQHVKKYGITVGQSLVAVHHVMPRMDKEFYSMLYKYPIDRLTVSDHQRLCDLGRIKYESILVPLWVEPGIHESKSSEFTVGILGIEDTTLVVEFENSRKRFQEIRAACRMAGVELVDGTRMSEREDRHFENVDDFFNAIDCYVVASYVDAGPMPALEALARQIPVVTTPTGSMAMYVKDGESGYITNGTVSDMVGKIEMVRNNPPIGPWPVLPTKHNWIAAHDAIYREMMA
jgi:glycosyltransferase involved in cell wall biosynthesis